MAPDILDRLLTTTAVRPHAFSVCAIQEGWRLAFADAAHFGYGDPRGSEELRAMMRPAAAAVAPHRRTGGREALEAGVGPLSYYGLAPPELASPATAGASPSPGVPSEPPPAASSAVPLGLRVACGSAAGRPAKPPAPAAAPVPSAPPPPSTRPKRSRGRSSAIVAFEPAPLPQADAEAEVPSLAPPAPPLPPELVARFRRVAGRLAALPPPPRMWNDFTDPVRLLGWCDRVAAVVAAREAAAQEAETARRVAFYAAASAAALEALAEPDADLAAERALLGAAPFRLRPGEALPWGIGAEVSAETVA
jgi:hypothetical protein